MRISIYFYEAIDPDGQLGSGIQELIADYPDRFRRGSAIFGVENLSQKEAYVLAAKIAVLAAKQSHEAPTGEMRLIIQSDVAESKPFTIESIKRFKEDVNTSS